MAKRQSKYRALWWILSFALLARLAHLPGDFLYDDVTIILENPLVQELQFSKIWTSPYWSMPERGIYRPLTVTTLALNQAILANVAWFYHLTNILIHLFNTYLLFMLLHRWLPRRHLGHAMMTLLFALHPALTEAIHLVVGRAELLVATCALAALHFASLYLQDRCKSWVLHLVVLATLLGLLCKESALVIPLLVWLLALTIERSGGGVLRRPLWPAARWPLVLLVLLLIALVQWRHHVLGGNLPSKSIVEMHEPLQRLWVPLQVVGMMAHRIFWPQQLQWDYDRFTNPAANSLTHPYVLVAIALILLWIAHGMLSRRRGRWLIPLWPLLAAGTTLQLVPIGAIFAERFLYLPILALVIGITFLLPEPKGYREEQALRPFAWFILALCFCLSVKASWAWRDKMTFWTTVKQQAPFSINANFNLAALHFKRGELEPARQYVEQNLQRNPTSIYGHRLLRDILSAMDDRVALEAVVRRLVELQPNNAEVAHQLALFHIERREFDLAEPLVRRAVTLDSENPTYRHNLVGLLLEKQQFTEAKELNQRLLEQRPHDAPALMHRLLITKALDGRRIVQHELAQLATLSQSFSERDKLALYRTLFLAFGCAKASLPEPSEILAADQNVVAHYRHYCRR